MLTLPKIILNFGGHSGEVLTILDKFIHLWGTLEKKWSQQALIIKHKEKIIFPPRQLLATRTIPADTPHSLQSLLMAPWEDQQKLAKDMNFFKSQLSQISICGAWLRQEGKNSRCPFLYKFRLAGRKKKLVIDSFSPRNSYRLPVCFVLCPEKFGLAIIRLPPTPPQNMVR